MRNFLRDSIVFSWPFEPVYSFEGWAACLDFRTWSWKESLFLRGCNFQKSNLKRRVSDSKISTIDFFLAHFAKRTPIFQGSTSDWGSVDRLGMRCGAMVRSIDSSSYHFQVTFGTFGVFFFSTPKKAAGCWQDLSQKIDDAIKSISDECYLQLDRCETSGWSNFAGIFPEIGWSDSTNSTSCWNTGHFYWFNG